LLIVTIIIIIVPVFDSAHLIPANEHVISTAFYEQ